MSLGQVAGPSWGGQLQSGGPEVSVCPWEMLLGAEGGLQSIRSPPYHGHICPSAPHTCALATPAPCLVEAAVTPVSYGFQKFPSNRSLWR